MPELLVVVAGLIVGGFLNLYIHRLPRGEAVLGLPRCPGCETTLRPAESIAVIGYFLRRHCPACGAAFPGRFVAAELLTAVLFVCAYLVLGFGPALIKILALTAFLVVVTFIDYDWQLIFDKVLLWLAGTGVIVNLGLKYAALFAGNGGVALPAAYVDWPDMAIAALAGGGVMFVLAVVGRGALGGGDVKFTAALGLWLGWKLTLLTVVLSFILGGVCGALLLLFGLKGRKDFIPFGPFIALSAYIALLYGRPILAWYLR